MVILLWHTCNLHLDASNDCTQDCAGDWGGSGAIDDCGVCDGDGTTCWLAYLLELLTQKLVL